jgi:trans-aconitate methyltransferase
MSMDQYEETFKTWEKVADLYDEKFMDFELYNESYDFFCKLIQDEQPKILDIGCGPGNISRYLQNKLPKSKITGIGSRLNVVFKQKHLSI